MADCIEEKMKLYFIIKDVPKRNELLKKWHFPAHKTQKTFSLEY